MLGNCYTCGEKGHPMRLCPKGGGKGNGGKGDKGGGKGYNGFGGKGGGNKGFGGKGGGYGGGFGGKGVTFGGGGKGDQKGTWGYQGNCFNCGKKGYKMAECRPNTQTANAVEQTEQTQQPQE